MSQEDTKQDLTSLGDFLTEQRQQKGVSLAEVSESTRISLPVLEAIEEDAYERMPAEAFCRGFYTMYANFLGLDPKDILDRYQTQLGTKQKNAVHSSTPPVKKSQNTSNYAEPSAVSPGTSMTFLLITALIIFIAICWHMKWNPMEILGNKLMPPPSPAAQSYIPQVEAAPTLSSPEQKNQEETAPATAASPYQLEIYFTSSSTLKVTLDDGFVLEKHFNAGETQRWEAEKRIVLDMPEEIRGNLRLNGIEIPLPEAQDGRRRLSLPEDLLDTN